MISSDEKKRCPEDWTHPECNTDTRDEKNPGDDCISEWKEQKDKTEAELKMAIAETKRLSEILKYAQDWEVKLKAYFDNIYKTNELSDKVAREANGFLAQVEKVCINADCTVIAIKALFCETRVVFKDHIVPLVEVMDRVNDCLKCITDPALVRDKGILKILWEYNLKLREIEGLQLNVYKKIIEALRCINILFYSICKGQKEEFACDSLMNELELLLEKFGNCTPCVDEETELTLLPPLWCERIPDSKQNCVSLVPVPVFPLCKDPYYKETENQHKLAKTAKDDTKNKLDDAKKKKEAIQACYDSLKNAIEKAEKAKATK